MSSNCDRLFAVNTHTHTQNYLYAGILNKIGERRERQLQIGCVQSTIMLCNYKIENTKLKYKFQTYIITTKHTQTPHTHFAHITNICSHNYLFLNAYNWNSYNMQN